MGTSVMQSHGFDCCWVCSATCSYFFFLSAETQMRRKSLMSECRAIFFFLPSPSELLSILYQGFFFLVSRAFQYILCSLTVTVGKSRGHFKIKKKNKKTKATCFFFFSLL